MALPSKSDLQALQHFSADGVFVNVAAKDTIDTTTLVHYDPGEVFFGVGGGGGGGGPSGPTGPNGYVAIVVVLG